MTNMTINRKLNAVIDGITLRAGHRGYLGLSQVGHSCNRYLWMTLHDIYQGRFSARTMRIFERGDIEEPRVIKDFLRIGATVDSTQEEINIFGGHVKGHIDGIIELPLISEEPMLLEIKAVQSNTWGKYYKNGVKESAPNYYAQMQIYMHYLKLNTALFVATNKNDEMRYYELVPYKKEDAQKLELKILTILGTEKIPPKIGGPDWWECKMCSMYGHCHEYEKTNICCRSCKSVIFEKDEMLNCKKDVHQDTETIALGCRDSWEDITR